MFSTVLPLDAEINRFVDWAKGKLGLPQYDYIAHIGLQPVMAEGAHHDANMQTLALYKQHFNHFLWTGIECSNPESPEGERWDQLQLAGMYDPKTRRKQIDMLLALGIHNVRLGLPNHLIDLHKSWRSFSAMLGDFKTAGFKVSLDLQHFGLPSRFRNPALPEQSVYLNPRWPGYFARLAQSTVKRYHADLDAITLINEPLITNKFSSLLWNEGFPGDYAHPLYYHYFIQRALLIAKAAVAARHRIEAHLLTYPDAPRLMTIHNESCEYHAHDPEFNDFGRFISSDLILGQDWLLNGQVEHTDMGRWLLSHYDRAGVRTDHQELLKNLKALRLQHLRFQDTFGKTMRTDTVFGVDYYLACESMEHGFEYEMPMNLDVYRQAIKKNQRRGLARIIVDYWNRYRLPILHTETNFADLGLAEEWGVGQLLELAQVAQTGVPVLGFTWYSLMDQYNWDNALKGSPQHTRIYPVGLLSMPNYERRQFARQVLPELLTALQG